MYDPVKISANKLHGCLERHNRNWYIVLLYLIRKELDKLVQEFLSQSGGQNKGLNPAHTDPNAKAHATSHHLSPTNPTDFINAFLVLYALNGVEVITDGVPQRKLVPVENPLVFKIGGLKIDLGEIASRIIKDLKSKGDAAFRNFLDNPECSIFLDSWIIVHLLESHTEFRQLVLQAVAKKVSEFFKEKKIFDESSREVNSHTVSLFIINGILSNFREILRLLNELPHLYYDYRSINKLLEDCKRNLSSVVGPDSSTGEYLTSGLDGCSMVLNGKRLLLHLITESDSTHIGSEYSLRNSLIYWGYQGDFSHGMIEDGCLKIKVDPNSNPTLNIMLNQLVANYQNYVTWDGKLLSLNLVRIIENLADFRDSVFIEVSKYSKELANALGFAINLYKFLTDQKYSFTRLALRFQGLIPDPCGYKGPLKSSSDEAHVKSFLIVPLTTEPPESDKARHANFNYALNFLALIIGAILPWQDIAKLFGETQPGCGILLDVSRYPELKELLELIKKHLNLSLAEDGKLRLPVPYELIERFLHDPSIFEGLVKFVDAINSQYS